VTRIPDETFVFNIVLTGKNFAYLRYFIASQIAHSSSRFRLIGNGCGPEELESMEAFRRVFPERVVEVFVAYEEIQAHGVALDRVRAHRDDGEFFALADPDIMATGLYVADFAERLAYGATGVGSGRGIWRDDSYLPEGDLGVSGEHFYRLDGFLFGSPHFALYRRAAVEETAARWGVGFGSAGGWTIPESARAVLHDAGFDYLIYDTAKVMNIFLQHDGNRLEHFEHRHLLHIGGMSHFLTQPDLPGGSIDDPVWPWPVTRLEVARYCAAVLASLGDGRPAPAVPAEVEPAIAARLARVRDSLVELVGTYRPALDGA
jgi:hypothetical protein